MTDPTSNGPNVTPDVTNVNDDQILNFSWWLCMLPFFAAIAFFVWRWFQNKADASFLMYAAGALIIGLVFTGMIAGAGASMEAEKSKSSDADANK
jgi:hypothetical protein